MRGLHMLAEDIEAGKGKLRIRQADNAKFKLGDNMAMTPGKVVCRNELMELIQYAPSTTEVYRRPLLIVPPWINKFYILDLNPEKSFIRWAVAQGLTVFVVSWVNPDERHADKGFEDYMREGVFAALDAIEAMTGETRRRGDRLLRRRHVAGGHARLHGGDRRHAHFQRDVVHDAGRFHRPRRSEGVHRRRALKRRAKMAKTGYLDGSQMANAFNMLRPND